MIPRHMQHSIETWVQRGLPHPSGMGSFLRSVLTHDLWTAAFHADSENRAALADWVFFVHNELPSHAHGDVDRLVDWHNRGGLQGKSSNEAA